MENELPPAKQEAMVRQHVMALMEHYDSVQILCSNARGMGTESMFLGGGNWYARQGMAHEFISQNHAHTEANEIARAIKEEDDG